MSFPLPTVPPKVNAASKISTLTQGMFVGAVADNFNERIELKIFHCEIVVDAEKVKREKEKIRSSVQTGLRIFPYNEERPPSMLPCGSPGRLIIF